MKTSKMTKLFQAADELITAANKFMTGRKHVLTSGLAIVLMTTAFLVGGCKQSKSDQSGKEVDQGSVAEQQMVDNINAYFSPEGKEITPATYPAAESARQYLQEQSAVGVNAFNHRRELTPTDKQTVVRMNRDTYYSFGVADVSKGATLIMPEIPEGKYMSGMVITEDHRIHPMDYGPGEYELSTHTGDHVFVAVRLDATFTQQEANAIQDQMRIVARSSEPFRAEPVDEASFRKVEEELKAKMPGILKRDGADALVGMFTLPSDASNELFNQEKYEVGAAVGWGGAQDIDNIYELSPPYPADVCHQMTFEDPENAAFWSITVYNGAGFMFSDVANVSSDTATPNEDGTYTLSFGCAPDAPNNLETANESGVFTLGIRHYRVGDKVKNGYRLLPTVKAVE